MATREAVHSLPDKLAKNFFDEPSQARALSSSLLNGSRMQNEAQLSAAGFCDVRNNWTSGD